MNTKLFNTLGEQLDYYVNRAHKEFDSSIQRSFYDLAFGAVLFAQRLAIADDDFESANAFGKLWFNKYQPAFEEMGVA